MTSRETLVGSPSTGSLDIATRSVTRTAEGSDPISGDGGPHSDRIALSGWAREALASGALAPAFVLDGIEFAYARLPLGASRSFVLDGGLYGVV